MSESKQYTTDELIYRFQIGGGKVEEHLRRQDVALAELTRAHAEAAAHYAQVVGERDARIAAADRLADTVLAVIHAQTNYTIDIVGLDKMSAQHMALREYRALAQQGGRTKGES